MTMTLMVKTITLAIVERLLDRLFCYKLEQRRGEMELLGFLFLFYRIRGVFAWAQVEQKLPVQSKLLTDSAQLATTALRYL